MLQVTGLTKYYGKICGVHDLNFEIAAGEIFGLVGPEGAGKSTALRSIMGQIAPNGGEVLLDEHLFDRRTPKRKAVAGFLPSEVMLYDDMRVGDVIRYHGTFYKNIDENRLGKLIRRLEIDMTKKTDVLSAEERKKVGLVLALMHRPKLIVLDEPAKDLAPMAKEMLFAILREEKQRGAAILYASDNLGEVRRLCDSAAMLRSGHIVLIDEIANVVNGFVHLITLECEDQTIAQRLGGTAIEREGETVRFLYEGQPDELIKALSGLHVKRLLIEEPPLDDILENYYQ